MLPILYSFRRCPYAMRARMALLVSGIHCEIREIKLSDKPAAMLAASPKATVPVLILPDGAVIDESLDIMQWALKVNDPERWMLPDSQMLIAENDGPFKHHLDRYKYADRYGVNPAPHQAAGLMILHTLETRLANTTNLCRAERSLADIALIPFIRQYAATDRAWFNALALPRLQNWLDVHERSQLFKKAMTRI